MHRVPTSWLRRVCGRFLLAAVCAAGVTPSAMAQTGTLDRDIDLTNRGLFLYSQNDPRWAGSSIGRRGDVTMANCGCLLAVLSTVLNYEMGAAIPWFPTPASPFGGVAFDFNPRYLDNYLNYGAGLDRPQGWGYKPRPPETCGVMLWPLALEGVAQFDLQPLGIGLKLVPGFSELQKRLVDANLSAGRPTIVVRRFTMEDGSIADHAQLIAGWDNEKRKYLVLDPRRRTGSRPQIPYTASDPVTGAPGTYEAWEASVVGLINVTLLSGPVNRWLFFGDDPSPIEILAIDPDGRRTGFDPATGSTALENPSASYWNLEGWADPFGQVQAGEAAKFTAITDPADGIHRFLVQGTGSGPFKLDASVFLAGEETVLQTFSGLIGPGDVRKYELHLSNPSQTFVSEVANFSPEARAGSDIAGVTGVPIPFDARLSRDDDGLVVSYLWNFGDGTTASGSAVSHAYASPGTYTATLTVADSAGLTATDTLRASVVLAQQKPVARPSGPYLGFSPPEDLEGFFYVLFNWQGSFDVNGDPLVARWDFGDGSPVQVSTPGSLGLHTYLAPGTYTVTLVVNDGIEDSEPATTTVEVLPWQNPRSAGDGTVALAPSCGAPGSTVRFTVDGLAVAPPGGGWNFGDGPLPSIPRRITLGIPNTPDGQLRVSFDGVRYFVPWIASTTSAAEFSLALDFVIPSDQPPGAYQFDVGEAESLPFDVPCAAPANQRPIADAGGPYAGAVGAALAFDGAASSDLDGDALTYSWDFGDGTFGSGVAPQHAYQEQGTYYVSLIVNDSQEDSFPADTRGFATVSVTGTATNTAPTFSHPNITTPATGPGGAAVTFTANGSDAEQGSIAAVCTPPSGSTFAIGTGTVQCTVTDSGGLTGTGSFTVTVTDTPPTFTPPANITTATSATGVSVTYTTPTATDFKDGTVPVTCTPASGSTFALGTTTVTCTATNSSGMITTRTFTVTVTATPTGPICHHDDDRDGSHHPGGGHHFHGDADDDHDRDRDNDHGRDNDRDRDRGDRDGKDGDRRKDGDKKRR